MEKYAVVLSDDVAVTDKTKTATVDKNTCPKCDRPLIENNQYLMFCVKCGTEPFEKQVK